MSRNKFFLKGGPKDNRWVRKSVIKPVDVVTFQTIKAIREGKNDKSENF